MATYMVMIKVYGSRHIEAATPEQARALAADQAHAAITAIEAADILGGPHGYIDDLIDDDTSDPIPLGLLAGCALHFGDDGPPGPEWPHG